MSEFETGFQEVVREFLHTVVVLDDQDPNESPDVSVPKQIETPEGVMAVTEDTSQEVIPPRISISTEFSSLVRKYANLGLVCAVIKPEEAEFQQIGVEIAKRADITILDWRMFDSDGTHTLELIGGIVQSDMEGAGRQRLIVIYTLEPKLSEIIQRVNQKLSEVGVEVTPEDFSLKSSSLSIVVYQKDSATTKPVPNRVATFNDLPEKTIQEFARANNGLLAKVALKGISTVRSETHHILKKLDRTMDEPYVAHRIMLEDPQDAEAFASDLVLGQIRDAFALTHVGEAVDTTTVKNWLKYRYQEDHEFKLEINFTREQFENMIENGLKDFPGVESTQITHALVEENDEAESRNIRFAQRATLLRDHVAEKKFKRPKPPILTLGTVLAERKSDGKFSFWLCLQPNCDSVRIESKRSFPFIKLAIKSLNTPPFDFIVNDPNNLPTCLRISLRPHEMRHFEFKADRKLQVVLPEKDAENKNHIFKTTDKEFLWVADLKFEYAQRIANNFAAQISRVGFDEFEWLRRKSGSK
jgi:hypothetical protein